MADTPTLEAVDAIGVEDTQISLDINSALYVTLGVT